MAQYVYGKNVVKQRLVEGKAILKIYFTQEKGELQDLARKKNVPIQWVDRKQLDKFAKNQNHQGVVAEIEPYKTYTLEELLPQDDHLGFLVLLDGIEDPHNLGAILRTCDAVGVDGVILHKTNAVGLTPTVAKVSAGAIDTVKVAEVTNLTQTLKALKSKGYWVVGTDVEQAQDYRTLSYDTPIVVVIGNEGKGMSRLVKEECDFRVTLPMMGKINSLNASVATGILLYRILDKRSSL